MFCISIFDCQYKSDTDYIDSRWHALGILNLQLRLFRQIFVTPYVLKSALTVEEQSSYVTDDIS